jgi:Zn-dependent protease with chaperone function
MRTDPIDPAKIVPAIEGLYAAAKLKKPRVVIVPSPLVMAFAYGASAWIWHCRKNGKDAATHDATRAATRDARLGQYASPKAAGLTSAAFWRAP